jgi:hypothetical protein
MYQVLAQALVTEDVAVESPPISTLLEGEFVGPIHRWQREPKTGQLRLQLPGGGWASAVSSDGTELLRRVEWASKQLGAGRVGKRSRSNLGPEALGLSENKKVRIDGAPCTKNPGICPRPVRGFSRRTYHFSFPRARLYGECL